MLNDIRLFIRLVEKGSFTKAAKSLNINRTTISRSIQDLEHNLKLTLIKRDPRTFELTEDGMLLFEQFRQSTTKLNETWTTVIDNLQDLHGVLRLAIMSENAKYVLLEHLPIFVNKYPNIKLYVTFTTEKLQLINQDFDIAISTVLHHSKSHQVEQLCTFDYKLYASPKYIERFGRPTTIEELPDHRYIGLLTYEGKEQNNFEIRNIYNDDINLWHTTSNLYMDDIISNASELAKSGDYITDAWENMVKHELATGELIPLMIDYIFDRLPCYLIRKSTVPSKPEQELIKFIEEVFKKLSPE